MPGHDPGGAALAVGRNLAGARARDNLKIIAGAQVNRVLVDGTTVRGVELATGSPSRTLGARRVILSAGAICTPAILLRSGIGPADELSSLGVGVRAGQIVLRTAAPGSDRANDMYYAVVNNFDLTHHFPMLRTTAEARQVFGVMAVVREAHSRGRVTIGSTERVLVVTESAFGSEEALRDYIRLGVDSAYNPVGTARMGPSDDPYAVVDQRCAVHGMDGLYVADASVMPKMVRANTNLTVIMIGERVAALPRET